MASAGDGERPAADAGQRQLAFDETLALLDTLLESAPVGVAFVNPELRYVRMNRALAAINGITPDQAVGRSLRDVVPRLADRLEPIYRQVLQTGQPVVGLELSGRTRGYLEPRHWLVSYYPVRVRAGEWIGVGVIVTDITDRKVAEDNLRISEERFRALFEQSPLSTQIFAVDGRPVRTNRAWEELWGSRLEDIPDYNILNDPQLVLRGLMPFIERGFAGQAAALPAIRYNPDETLPGRTRFADPTRWVRAFLYPIKDVRGQVREVVLVHEDISEQRRTEEALRHSEERFRLALASGALIVFQQDLELRYTWVYPSDPAFAADNIGRSDDELLPPEDAAPLVQIKRQVIVSGQGQRQEVRATLAPGLVRYYDLVVEPWRDSQDRIIGVGGVAVDVTQRRQVEQALRDREQRLRLLTELIPQQVWTALPDGAIDYCNEQWLRYTGLTPQEAQGHGWMAVLHPADRERVQDQWQQAVSGGSEYQTEVRLRGVEGAYRWFLTRALPLHDEQGHVVKWYGTNTDIEDRRRMEEALREADRRKDEFLAMLAHELRNPLAPVRNAVEILKMIGPSDGRVEEARDMISRQVAHMARLVDDLLDVSRITRGKILLRKELLDLAPLLRTTAGDHRPQLQAAGLHFTLQLPEQPVWVEGDPTRLAQMVGNLLHNAVKFTDPAGEVLVQLSADPERREAVVRVRDTGIGMDEGTLARLFEPFSQADRSLARSRGGLGLGLALVKGLAELHGGRVEVASSGPGQGTEVVLGLPLGDAPAMQQASALVDGASGRRQRILIIEDSRDAAESMRIFLELVGHQVAIAHTGPIGLEQARSFRPAVVLCDIGLPGGMDGYAVARALRADPELFGVHLIAVSGYGQEEDQRQARQAGFDRHLTKPVDPAALAQLLAGLAVP